MTAAASTITTAAQAPQENPLLQYHATLARHAHVKRFYERWVADPAFRAALTADPAGTLERYRIDVDPADVRGLIENDPRPCPATRAMWEIVQAKIAAAERYYGAGARSADPAFAAWRQRQVERQRLDLGPFLAASNIHAALCVELTKGCSVGCWFCALSPDRLGGVFRHAENAALWRASLDVFAARLGAAVRSGFLYWATDPLDNPDYEQFCLDFHDAAGVFPPTTTALALKDPARTRRLLALAQERGCWLNRFSILAIPLLDRVHAEFDAEELALVECLPLNKDAAFAYGNSGRFRDRALRQPRLLEEQREKLKLAPWFAGNPDYAGSDAYANNSIGCVTGFLVNMVERKVELISPCTASDRWPLGYIVYGSGTFGDAAELDALLGRLMTAHMRQSLDPARPVRFHDWLTFEPAPAGFTLHGRFRQTVDVHGDDGEYIRAIGHCVSEGRWLPDRIAGAMESAFGRPPQETLHRLDALLATGAIEEGP
jgi:radical SAM family RiPP maturation amino acid epimerase